MKNKIEVYENFKKQLYQTLSEIEETYQFQAPSDSEKIPVIIYQIDSVLDDLLGDDTNFGYEINFSVRYYVTRENTAVALLLADELKNMGCKCNGFYFEKDTENELLYRFDFTKFLSFV